MEAVILIGIQGRGKSSFYQQRFFYTHVRINLDMLRTRRRERLLLEACLKGRQPFVIDNTNVTAEERARYITPAREAGLAVAGYYFRAEVGKALERNRQRPGRARVPDKGLQGTYKRLQLPNAELVCDYFRVEFSAALGRGLKVVTLDFDQLLRLKRAAGRAFTVCGRSLASEPDL